MFSRFAQKSRDGARQESVKISPTTYILGLSISSGLSYLWKIGYKRASSALSLVSLGSVFLYYLLNARKELHKNHLIVISGCDSGLGYSLALCYCNKGAMVVAGLLDPDGSAGKSLSLNGANVFHLDFTDCESVEKFAAYVKAVLSEKTTVLHALVNNAAVMIYGEFEWQTMEQVQQQIDVNLVGPMRLTQKLMPALREHNSRVIIISSHCASESLPGLSIYGATKAALHAWSTSLRVELANHGVKVISCIPGNFVSESNIMARQKQHFECMKQAMTEETKSYYGDYFTRYAQYYGSVTGEKNPKCMTNSHIYDILDGALLDVYPSTIYKYEPWRYFFYYTLFKYAPIWMRDRLVTRFVRMPSWK